MLVESLDMSHILEMTSSQRFRLYNRFRREGRFEEEKEAKRLVRDRQTQNASQRMKESWSNPTFRENRIVVQVNGMVGRKHTERARQRMSEKQTGRDNGFFGKEHSVETLRKMSERRKQWMIEHDNPMEGKKHSEEARQKISDSNKGRRRTERVKREKATQMKGKGNPNWRGGASYLPYCLQFNESIKETIRNRDGRICVVCGKGEILNGRKLAIHHINSDKMQGCNGKPWALVSLCNVCHGKMNAKRTKAIEWEFVLITNVSIGGQ